MGFGSWLVSSCVSLVMMAVEAVVMGCVGCGGCVQEVVLIALCSCQGDTVVKATNRKRKEID
jgi:hypothetical protein